MPVFDAGIPDFSFGGKKMVNPFELVKNLKNVEENMKKIKDELAGVTATGSAGGNIVQVTLNGQFSMVSIKIDPIAQGDVPMLQDLIVAAHHNAMEKIQEVIKEKAGPLLGGMNLDGLNSPGL